MLGEYQDAINDCNVAISLNPLDAAGYGNRGSLHLANGKYSKTIDDYNSAINLDQNLPESFVGRALAYTFMGNDELASPDIERSIELGYSTVRISEEVREIQNQRIAPLNTYYEGRILHFNLVDIERVEVLRYSPIDPESVVRSWRLATERPDTELVLVHLKVENHNAVSVVVNIDQQAASLVTS